MTEHRVNPLQWLSTKFASINHSHNEYVNPTIVDNLTTDDNTKVLSAKQGQVLKTSLDGKADSVHNHNDVYYSKSEIDNKIITDVSGLTDNQGLLFSGDYDDLTDKPNIPSSSSDLIDGSNIIKKSSTNGLIKNDGSIDTNTYLTSSSLNGYEQTSNKVTSLDSFSTDTEYPSAKAVYDELWTNLYGTIQSEYVQSNQFGDLAFENDVDLSGHDLDELSDNTNLLFSGDYTDLDNKPTIPTQTSQLTNNSGFITSSSLSNYLQQSDVKDNLTSTDTNKPLSANQGKELKSLIDNKEDNIETIIGEFKSGLRYLKVYSSSPSIENKLMLYKIPTFGSTLLSEYVTLDFYANNQTVQYKRKDIYKNGIQITFNDVGSNSWLLLSYEGTENDGQWNLISSSSYAEANHTHSNYLTSHQDVSDKEDKSNKVTSLSSSSTDTQYPSAKLVYDQLNNKAPTSHASSSTTYGVATASNYGHTKVINNLITSSNNNGEALSAYQGKVLNDNKLARDSIDSVEGTGKNNSLYNCISFYSGEGNGQVTKGNDTVILQCVGHNSVFLLDMNKLKSVIDFNDADEYKICDFSSIGSSQFSVDNTTYSTFINGGKIYGSMISGRLVISIYDGNDNEIFYTDANYMPSYVYIHMQTNQSVMIMTMSNIDNIDGTIYINAIANIIYPVGSIYMSMSSTSPQTLFGGLWEQLKDRFLLGVGDTYSADSTGGSATVTLTASQSGVPAHSHKYQDYNTTYTLKTTNRKPGTSTAVAYGTSLTAGGGATERTSSNNTAANASQAHENMPPYLTVYMWKRTA